MPYRKEQFVNGEIYHVTVKSIDENVIFKNVDDHFRGIFSIFEFNNAKPVVIIECRKARARIKKEFKKIAEQASAESAKGRTSDVFDDLRDKFVEVLAFCIMPNHIHLLLRQLKTDGISKFMVKFGSGYGGYFNRKYNRKGYVFQNRFVAVHIGTEEQLKTVFVYIHTNPISLIEPKWKEMGIKEAEKAIEFVENYKWSSYSDYIGKKNFFSVTDREFISEIMGGENGCKEFVEDWIKYKCEIKKFANLAT
ncbi:transposase, partial [Patescibacteria group bacterium]|nr:transposase [Patescibacteria group bacterium]